MKYIKSIILLGALLLVCFPKSAFGDIQNSDKLTIQADQGADGQLTILWRGFTVLSDHVGDYVRSERIRISKDQTVIAVPYGKDPQDPGSGHNFTPGDGILLYGISWEKNVPHFHGRVSITPHDSTMAIIGELSEEPQNVVNVKLQCGVKCDVHITCSWNKTGANGKNWLISKKIPEGEGWAVADRSPYGPTQAANLTDQPNQTQYVARFLPNDKIDFSYPYLPEQSKDD
jgi:hypothetical protein